MKMVERPLPANMRQQMMQVGGAQHAMSLRFFAGKHDGDTIRAMLAREHCGELPDGRPDMRWQISVSVKGQTRLPTWEELKLVRRALKPDVFFVLAMPPERYWMNYAEVLHLSETRDANAIAQMKFEGERAAADRAAGIGYGATLEESAIKRRLAK